MKVRLWMLADETDAELAPELERATLDPPVTVLRDGEYLITIPEIGLQGSLGWIEKGTVLREMGAE